MAETPNTVCHIEMNVRDLNRAKAFYGRLFGWSFREFTPTMLAFGTDAGHIGGLQQSDEFTPGDSPSVWFRVEEIEPVLALATAEGGALVAPKDDLPGVGWSAQFADPDGNTIGLVEFAA